MDTSMDIHIDGKLANTSYLKCNSAVVYKLPEHVRTKHSSCTWPCAINLLAISLDAIANWYETRSSQFIAASDNCMQHTDTTVVQ